MTQEPMVLRFATAHPDGSICLILDEEDHDESDSIVLEYQPNRSPKWRRYEPEIRLEGVCSLSGAEPESPRFIAITAEGDLVDIIDDLTESRIPGAGYDAPDSLGARRYNWDRIGAWDAHGNGVLRTNICDDPRPNILCAL